MKQLNQNFNAQAVKTGGRYSDSQIKRVKNFFNRENVYKQLKTMVSFLIPHKKNVKLNLNIGGGSFTDGKSITVGLPELFINRPLGEIFSALRALIGHESQHINSSDFEAFVQFQNDVADYLYKKYKIPHFYGKKVARVLFNSVEDGRIEKILCNKLPGYKKHIQFLNGSFWEHQEIKGNSELEDFLYTITSYSVTGLYPKGFKNFYKDTALHQNMKKIESYIHKGIDAVTCKDCVMVCHEIIEEVEDYLAELLKNKTQEDEEFMRNIPDQSEFTTSEEKEKNTSDSVSTHFVPKKKKKDEEEKKEEEQNEDQEGSGSDSGEEKEEDKKEEKGKGKGKGKKQEEDQNEEEADGQGEGEESENKEGDEDSEDENGSGKSDKSEDEESDEEAEGSSKGDSDEDSNEDSDDESTDGDSGEGEDSDEESDKDSDENSDGEGNEDSDEDSEDESDENSDGDSDSDSDSDSDNNSDSDSNSDEPQDPSEEEEDSDEIPDSTNEYPSGVNQDDDNDIEIDEEFIRERMKEITDEVMEEAESKLKEDKPKKESKKSSKEDMEEITPEELQEVENQYRNQSVKKFKEIKGFKNNYTLPIDIKREGTKFRKEVEKIFRNKESYNLMAQKKGLLDTANLWKVGVKDYNVFMKKGTPVTTDYVAFILQDGSGSMTEDGKEFQSAKAMAVMEEGLKGIVPFKMSTFSVEYYSRTVVHFTAKDWKDNQSTQNYAYNFHRSRRAGGGNKDGYSIRVATAELMRRPEKDRILIILSDGLPSDYNGGQREGMVDVKQAVKEARKKGIHVVSLIFGTEDFRDYNIDNYKFMYDKNIISCKPEQITNNIVKMLKKIISR